MPLCASLVHSPHLSSEWTRCPRPIERGDLLCSAHHDALNGLAMGILETNFANHVR